MNERDFSAIDRKEKQLFSNSFEEKESTLRRGSGSYSATEIPRTWGETNPLLRDRPKEPKSFGLMLFLVATLCFLLASAFTAYVFLNKKNVVSSANIDTLLTIKPYVEGGEITPVTYSIGNRNTLPLLNAVFTISYEKGVGTQDEQNKVQQKIELGDIGPGEIKTGEIMVQLYGAENSSRDIIGKLDYKVSGSNATLSKNVLASAMLQTPPVSVTLDSQTKASAEDAYPVTVTIKNNTSSDSGPILLSLSLPSSYQMTSASEKPMNKTPSWAFQNLSPGQEKKIIIDGAFKGAVGEAMNIKAVVGSQSSQPGTIANVYSFDSKDITLSRSNLSVALSLSGETGDVLSTTVLPGSRVRAVITYENISDVAISVSSIIASIKGVSIDPTTVTVDSGFFDSKGGTITWTGATEQAISSLAPGDRGSLIFSFAIPQGATNETPLQISVIGRATTLDASEEFSTKDGKSWFIQGGAQVSGSIAYKNSPKTNSGPLPPKANQTTTYTITFAAQSDTKVKNAVVSARLPLYVTWLNDVVEGSQVTYNERTRTVSWLPGEIEKGGAPRASFRVAVRPSLTHVGSMPQVTTAIQLEAVDSVSGQTIKGTAPAITTYLGKETTKTDISKVVGE